MFKHSHDVEPNNESLFCVFLGGRCQLKVKVLLFHLHRKYQDKAEKLRKMNRKTGAHEEILLSNCRCNCLYKKTNKETLRHNDNRF